ncbi:MAG: hypothetical protein Q8907_14035 [Bacteroidota bacterium]|nr:hypothetical protein [Bacteroidota bacterium]
MSFYLNLLSLFILLTISCHTNIDAQEYNPRKQLFDYNWKFFLGDTANARSKDFNDEHWRSLDLPNDGSIEGKTRNLKVDQTFMYSQTA